ncbi:N-6 DNA methylase [Crocosphaera sp.]|uniref:HsdM family class I SAM-dependent methyltransferase n=1 Tax=Crocosphaera sp. TaxID=2729996 RepID=UPI002613671F|nr:N-6 DNA methylase [Crocosphaera sp.]MDJ0582609.1 N-6 DNA methylase [Crocosphaera sp.]
MRESDYISNTSISYRKDYGQFFTPSIVASIMAKWLIENKPKKILDPAFGLGVFYKEINKINLQYQWHLTAYEIDENILSYLDDISNKKNLNILNQDYLDSDINYYDAIICNPPYLRFQKFINRHNVLPKIEQQIGKKLVGYSNIASIFLIKALQQLNNNGRLAFILPFEFFNTGYGKEIKKTLIEQHLLKQIIIFDNEKDIFPDATTTICILLCENNQLKQDIKITKIKTTQEIKDISNISNYYHHKLTNSQLPHNQKWTPIILSLVSPQKIPEGFCKLSEYGTFKRGIATGANDFFALNKSKIEQLQISDKNVCLCITKSNLIKEAIFTDNELELLIKQDKNIYCLDVKKSNDKTVINYLKLGEEKGYNQRYLTKSRNPWYKLEKREPAPILFGVFNRGRLKVIRNFTTAINFTCYHGFYPNILGHNLIDKLFIYLISDLGQEIIKMNKRSYGNNLDKFEPRDLNNSYCPNMEQFNSIQQQEIREIIKVATIDEKKAILMSNQLIKNIINR